MDFIDLKSQQARIKDKIDAGIARVLAHGQYILGPEVAELEERLAAYTGAKHCITVANGTVSFALGEKTDRQCTPERVSADDAILANLAKVSSWRRDDGLLVLEGGDKPLRFRPSSN